MCEIEAVLSTPPESSEESSEEYSDVESEDDEGEEDEEEDEMDPRDLEWRIVCKWELMRKENSLQFVQLSLPGVEINVFVHIMF